MAKISFIFLLLSALLRTEYFSLRNVPGSNNTMSGPGSSGPSGRSPFPTTRSSRARVAPNTGSLGATTTGSTLMSGLGNDSILGRNNGSFGVAANYGGNPLLLSSGLSSTMSSIGIGADSLMETSVQPGQQHQMYQQQSPAFHGMLRFSPNNSHLNSAGGSSWSPLHRPLSVTNAGRMNKARFFESSNANTARSQTSHPFHSNEGPDTEKNDRKIEDNVTVKNNNDQIEKDELVIDGIPIDQLRSLSLQALSQSPETSVFYTSILYAKTREPQDALFLAKAHFAAGQHTACLRILDESSLLQQEYPWDAVIVACLALAGQQNWLALAEMVEDICRIPDSANFHDNTVNANAVGNGTSNFRSLSIICPPLEDDDTLGWIQLKHSIDASSQTKNQAFSLPTVNQLHPLSQICVYRAQAYYELSNIMRSVVYWKRALQLDCQCQMAWEALLKRNLLTPGEAYDWITHEITFRPEQEWLRSLYLARIELPQQETSKISSVLENNLNEHTAAGLAMNGTAMFDASSIHLSSPMPSFTTPGVFSKGVLLDEIHIDDEDHLKEPPKYSIREEIDTAFANLLNKHKLQDAPQVLAMAARRSYRRYQWRETLAYCEDLAHLDPAISEAAFCYVSTLVLKGYKHKLFQIAHHWVEASPKSAQAWFAVGSYYYCIHRYHVAQRHFCRATRIDPQCTEAWIAFGCSFAACDESDQALASYRAAQRLSPGEHTPLLYMGMEYVRTNHLVLAGYFLNSALTASGGDPLCSHELGVLASHKGDHTNAIYWFRRALNSVSPPLSDSGIGSSESTTTKSLRESVDLLDDNYWEPTLFNLGHAYRKTRQFQKAAICFSRCIALCPDKYSTYAALGFTRQMMGDIDSAVTLYHQALGLRADDAFSTEMLNRALREQMMSQKQHIFDTTTTTGTTTSLLSTSRIPPLGEATNLSTASNSANGSASTNNNTTTKETNRNNLNLSLSSMLLSSPATLRRSSRGKADSSIGAAKFDTSTLSEEMDCDLSGTS